MAQGLAGFRRRQTTGTLVGFPCTEGGDVVTKGQPGKRPSTQRRPVTLRDVALLARVDLSVVSRVVNDDVALKVTPATRRRVEEALRESGYRPNLAARGLRTAKTYTVGFVLPELTNPVYAPIVSGVQERADASGYVVVLGGTTTPGTRAEDDFAQLLDNGRVDGFLVSTGSVPEKRLGGLKECEEPVVLVNRALPQIDSVVVDDQAGAHLATQHLLELGHRQLAHVGGPRGLDTAERRLKGFQLACEEAGLANCPAVRADTWSPGAAFEAACHLLDGHQDLTALVVSTVSAGTGVLHAATIMGRVVPDDLSIIVMHDMPTAAFTHPPLTTVVLPLQELGRRAFDLLLARIGGAPLSGVVMVDGPPELLQRSSTGPPPA